MRTNSINTVLFLSIVNFIAVILFSSACNRMPSYQGYKLVEKKFVREVNAECILLEHVKSGAKLLKVAADNPNKTFGIAFRTIPETDAGIPHIMEHSVLNGSKNFPVKSPFDVLVKGSLNTFLNAMTYADFTVYPVASMNNKDYFNLMHVYLDAVFNPLIYDDIRIFMQEGWHFEMTSRDNPLIYKGVVYNEMKGAFSSPTRELWYQIQKNLFPDNAYGNSSGGYPTAIPSLTYRDFLDFHKKYYHPSNSLIFLYGDADLADELAFIDHEYLSHYDRSELSTEVPLHTEFEALKEVTAYYPVMEGTPVDDQTYLALNWVIGEGSDELLLMALDVLADVLFNQESAPVRLALQEAGIGKDVSASTWTLQQNIFSIIVQKANPADRQIFRKVILETLQKVCNEGLDMEALAGSLNRMEFRLREGEDANTGVNQCIRAIPGWLYANDPFVSLEYEDPLYRIKESLESSYLTDIILDKMLGNSYGLILALEPKQGLEQDNMKKMTEELSLIKAGFTDQEIDSIVSTTNELIEYQKREDSQEAMAAIPMLALSDIDRNVPWYEAREEKIDEVKQLIYNEFTNGIVYVTLWFDLRVLSQEMIPYASLLSEMMGKLDTEKRTFGQLDKALNINTGGFTVTSSVLVPDYDDANFQPKLQIKMKTTSDKLEAAMRLLDEIINQSRFDDMQRIRDLLARHQSQLELNISNNGYSVAQRRLTSYLTQQGKFTELTSGVAYYWFVTELMKQYDSNSENIVKKLEEASNLIFSRNNLISGITCSETDYELYLPVFKDFIAVIKDKPAVRKQWMLNPEPANEGFLTASKVQYVLQGYNFRTLGMEWNGKWSVLDQILSSEWLQTQIRVIGGAYGGFSGINRYGTVYFASYRDPNLKETLDNYRATVDFLKGFKADTNTMTRFIIGTIAGIDRPLTPEQKGDVAFRRFLENTLRENLQKDRDAILTTSADDIRNMSDEIAKILQQNVFCVYGNEDKLQQNRSLFTNLIRLYPVGVSIAK